MKCPTTTKPATKPAPLVASRALRDATDHAAITARIALLASLDDPRLVLTQPEVTLLVRLSDVTQHRLRGRDLFPQPLQPGAKRLQFRGSDIARWLRDRPDIAALASEAA